jgi:hypothetical protein
MAAHAEQEIVMKATTATQRGQSPRRIRRYTVIVFAWIFSTSLFSQLTACSGSATSSGALTVASMSPTQLTTNGGQVAFAGTNFTKDTTVKFGDVAASQVYFQSSTLITAVSPAVGSPSTANVTVSSPKNGSVTLSGALQYVTPPPPVTGSSCTTLPCTYKATDPGNTLVGGAQISSCAGCPDGIKVGSLGYGSDVIINHVYAPAAGNYTLTITGCEGAGTQDYQVIVDGGAPVTVPLTGSNWFTPAAPVSISIPLQAGSNNTVELGNATNYSPDVISIQISSLIQTAPITVTALSPTQLPQSGGTVQFTGTNFTPDISVTFGGVAASSFSYTSATQFTAVAPAATAAGAVDVVVSSPSGGTVTLSKGLTYVAECTTLPCTYLATNPDNTLVGGAKIGSCTGCPGGVKVGNLGYGADVIINNVYAPSNGNYTLSITGCEGGGTQNYQVIVDGGTPIIVPLTGTDWNNPAAPVSITIPLQAGDKNTVELGNASAYSPDAVSITISPANAATFPTITSITPNQSTITGGQVVLQGTNFEPNSTITFGGIPAPGFTFQSSTQITVNAPASSAAGVVDVVLNTPTNGDVTDAKAFTYTEPAPCTSATCVYQAWDPANTLAGGGKTATCIGCPYGLKVGNLGYGATVTINNVYAPADGNYLLSLVASEGGGDQILQAVVNGGSPISIPFTGHNWYLATPPVAVTVPLKKGSSNTIQLGNASNYSPDVVYAIVNPANIPTSPASQTVTMQSGANTVTYDLGTGLAIFSYNGIDKISNFYAQGYNGFTLYQSTSSVYTRTSANLANGETDITLTPSDGSPTLIQRFYLSNNHFTTQLEMDGTNLSSNEMSPVVVSGTGAVDIGSYADTRFLQVPFDNDNFVSYNAASSNGLATTGFEVGTFYDNTSRNGLVIGSVTHDNWKTGISMSGSNNKLDALTAFGGANTPSDQLPHASVVGNKITSPTVLVGYYSDWRDGMEDYANANAQVTPMLAWSKPAPMGWGTLGPNEASLTAAKATTVADYFHTQLPQFNDQGVQYINLDAEWANISDADLATFVNHVHSQGQKAGVYWTPWVIWDWTDLTAPLDGVTGYTGNDVVMKDHYGNPMAAVDSAYAVDPTHPGVKARIDYYSNKYLTLGFDYIKMDFLSHGALEGGSNSGVHYDTTVQTGEQAYNQGMAYLDSKIGTSLLLDESIAPVFPYQYAHARRVSCDTYGSIANTSYEMNSESYGWWLAGRLYNWNDPDEIHLENTDTTGTPYTTYENKSRMTSVAVSGYMLSGDDVTDSIAPPLIQKWLTNSSINALPALNLKFRPVEGNTGTSAVNVMVAQNGTTYYLAVFNYDGSNASTQTIDLGRAGLNSSSQYTVTDLWTGTTSSATGSISVNLNPAESTILQLQ